MGFKKIQLRVFFLSLVLHVATAQASQEFSFIDSASKIGGLCAVVCLGYKGLAYVAQTVAGKKITKGRDYSDYGYVNETPIFFVRKSFLNKSDKLVYVLSEHEYKKIDEQLQEDEFSLEKIQQSIERRKKLIKKNEDMAKILKGTGSSASFSTSSLSSLASSTMSVITSASFDSTKSVSSK